jgi:hypothetical protein
VTSPSAQATVLELGARGKLRGAAFALTGRTLVRSEGGGIWNEWTMRFDDGRLAFLAEARGGFTLFTERPLGFHFEDAQAGKTLDTGYVVVERGKAKRIATWGDVPDAPETYRYVDLSSKDGESATIDWGEPLPRVFVGSALRLDALGLTPRKERPRFVPIKETRAPKGVGLDLAIGTEGRLERGHYRVLGVLHRSIKIERARYTWEEYLLHDPREGFRWLAVSEGTYTLVEGIEPGLVSVDRDVASFQGLRYQLASEGTARVEWAAGEMPWEVAIGDTVAVKEYAKGGRTLSFEGSADEIAWSRGAKIPAQKIKQAFRR